MADWIKVEMTTPDKPEVAGIAERLGIDPDAVTGKLIRLWVWADSQSVDGNAISVTDAFLDRLTFCPGFAAAMRAVGWLLGDSGRVTFPRFERHNGESAKKRALGGNRVQKHRSGVTQPALQNDAFCNAASVTDALPEKRREEKIVSVPERRDGTVPEGGRRDGEGPSVGVSDGDLPAGVPAGATKAAATERVIRRLGWVCDTWQPRLAQAEMIDLAAQLSIWEELRDDDWRLLRWWYRVRRPKLVEDNKPGERIFPGSDRAYLLNSPTKCLDAIREKWQAARCPDLRRATKAKAKVAGEGERAYRPNGPARTHGAEKSPPVAEMHPMERLLETDPARYEALSRAVWEGPLSAVDEIVIRGEKADPALALMRVHDLMAERLEKDGETRRQGDSEMGSSGELERGAAA